MIGTVKALRGICKPTPNSHTSILIPLDKLICKFLICEKHKDNFYTPNSRLQKFLGCDVINPTMNVINPIRHQLPSQGRSHPITLTLYLRNALYTHAVLDPIVSYAKASLSLSKTSHHDW